MKIDPDALLNWRFPLSRQKYEARDAILYALGVGLGADPLDERQLRFVYEKELRALPTYPVVLGFKSLVAHAKVCDPGAGVDWTRALHGQQGLRLHATIPVAAEVVCSTRITGVVDKGPGKGALIESEREVREGVTNRLLCTLTSTTVCRNGGGFSGDGAPRSPAAPVPTGAPDAICEIPTLPQAALIYRLSGDENAIHVDPQAAREAGLEHPILHGLCTFGIAGHAILKTLCGYEPDRLRALDVRFSAPVYPGETIVTEFWQKGASVTFQARTRERGSLVLSAGRAEIGTTLSHCLSGKDFR